MKKLLLYIVIFLSASNIANSQCPNPPNAGNNGDFCESGGLILNLSASDVPGATYSWTGPNGFTSTLQNPVINNITMVHAGDYFVTATVNGCTSAPSVTKVVVKPNPAAPVAGSNGPYLCNGETLNLTASNVSGAVYEWTGPNGFTSTLQNPVINNFTILNAGTYNVIAKVNGCGSPAAITTVVLQPPPVVYSSNNGPLCLGQALNLTAIALPGTTYSWTGPNGFSSTLQNPTIPNVSFADTGLYIVTASLNGCIGPGDTTHVIIRPMPTVPVITINSPVCEGSVLNLNTPALWGLTYSWSGPNGFTSTLPNPSINNVTPANGGIYNLTVTGCISASNTINVVIIPSPAAPLANNNGPLCVGQTLNLTASTIAGATYTWTGPNGFTSSLHNPVINNAATLNMGTYSVTAKVNGCSGAPGTTSVVVRDSVRSNAGSNQTVCTNSSFVNLSGTITGGSSSGIWSTSGTGTFSPNNSSLNAAYNLTNSDITAGNVTITLTSTNNGGCPASLSTLLITIPPLITVDAGADQNMCASDSSININGQISSGQGGTWSTTGNGIFIPSNNSLNAKYIPSSMDKTRGSIIMTLTSQGNGTCPPVSDSKILVINPGPSVVAGSERLVRENQTITLEPQIAGSNLKYLWKPGLYLNNDTIKTPVVTGVNDQLYTIEVTDGNGCKNSDSVSVKVLRAPVIPNTFTPNNDGINDTWVIKNLDKYPDCKLQIFNRYGLVVFESKRYVKPWDGTMKGNSLPFGTYYYVIEPGNGVKPFSGYVTLIK